MGSPVPTERLYANEMADNPYTRYGITENTQTQIAPTLIRQKPYPPTLS